MNKESFKYFHLMTIESKTERTFHLAFADYVIDYCGFTFESSRTIYILFKIYYNELCSCQENIALVSLGTKALWNFLYFDHLVLILKPSEQSGVLITK